MELTRSRRGRSASLALVLAASLALVHIATAADATVKTSNIIPSAGVANLANGNGDVSSSGILNAAPAAERMGKRSRAFTSRRRVREGHQGVLQGRRRRRGTALHVPDQEDARDQKGQRRGCVGSCAELGLDRGLSLSHAGRKVSDKCMDELATFKMDRSSNINKDVPLGACEIAANSNCLSNSPLTRSQLGRARTTPPSSARKCPINRPAASSAASGVQPASSLLGQTRTHVRRAQGQEEQARRRMQGRGLPNAAGGADLCAHACGTPCTTHAKDGTGCPLLSCAHEPRRDAVFDILSSRLLRTRPSRPLKVTEDYRNDYKLYNSCKDDVKNLCADVDPGDGREIECLVSEATCTHACMAPFSWRCWTAISVHPVQLESGGEGVFSVHLICHLCLFPMHAAQPL